MQNIHILTIYFCIVQFYKKYCLLITCETKCKALSSNSGGEGVLLCEKKVYRDSI
jgi:hypothetical protein